MGTSAYYKPAKIREEFSQLSILTRHFFGRLFRNDIIDFEDQMKGRLIAILSVLAIIVGWISELFLFKYNLAPDANLSWQEKNYVFMLMMIIFGIITLLELDILFPDRRDFLNLRPLPARLRTIFCAKLASFILFIGMFSTAMNSMSSVLFAIYLGQWRSNSPFFLFRYVFAHLVSAFAACFCVFFACVFINFILMAFLPLRIYHRASLLIRFLLIAVFVFFLLALIIEPAILDSSFRSLPKLKDSGASFVLRFPPLWFVGLYEVLVGTRDPIFGIQAKTAGLALLFSLVAFVLASGLSYYRHVLKTLETNRASLKLFRLRESITGLFQNGFLRSSEERAVASFFSKTIRSSRKHQITLTNYMAIAAGFILLFIFVNRRGFQYMTPENANLLAQPLILSIVLLAGIRTVVDIPAASDAKWIFQITETTRRSRYASGFKKMIFFKWLLPLSILVFLSHLLLWRDWRPAFNHAIFGLTISGLAIEAVFYRYRKIPFACMNVPGKLKLQTRVVPYFLGFILFLVVFSFIEKELLRNPSKFVFFFAFSAVVWAALRIGSVRYLKTHPLIYEEEPEPALITFSD